MFAYCGNNPVKRIDTEGYLWVEIGIGIIVAGITGIANGYSSYSSGGEFWPAFWIGVGSGGLGYALSLASCSPLALVGIRMLTSLGSNIATTYVNNGAVSGDDLASCFTDAVMDGMISTLTYYYNPFSGTTGYDKLLANGLAAVLDGTTDIAETLLFSQQPKQFTQNSKSSRNSAARRMPHNYVSQLDKSLIY